MTSVVELGERAKAASRALATASTSAKNSALLTAADLLLERAAEIQSANDADLEAAQASGMAAGPLDRLRLTDARLEGMAKGLRTVAGLPDPVGLRRFHRRDVPFGTGARALAGTWPRWTCRSRRTSPARGGSRPPAAAPG